ncbi:putative PAS domain S-box protein [Paratrimastix pyriformis]|uniref:PAS domain S-box protein n=1 Tax=Paratrimastix pyriformis TaxID=342808 RepID=A0ABQ8UHE1_9EUKA|nr:putative PAS domain S-box protein [Paratrimastix pyriformis]
MPPKKKKAGEGTAGDEAKRSKRWTPEEHNAFVDAFETHGRDWDKIAAAVGTRDARCVLGHAQYYLLRLLAEGKPLPASLAKTRKGNGYTISGAPLDLDGSTAVHGLTEAQRLQLSDKDIPGVYASSLLDENDDRRKSVRRRKCAQLGDDDPLLDTKPARKPKKSGRPVATLRLLREQGKFPRGGQAATATATATATRTTTTDAVIDAIPDPSSPSPSPSPGMAGDGLEVVITDEEDDGAGLSEGEGDGPPQVAEECALAPWGAPADVLSSASEQPLPPRAGAVPFPAIPSFLMVGDSAPAPGLRPGSHQSPPLPSPGATHWPELVASALWPTAPPHSARRHRPLLGHGAGPARPPAPGPRSSAGRPSIGSPEPPFGGASCLFPPAQWAPGASTSPSIRRPAPCTATTAAPPRPRPVPQGRMVHGPSGRPRPLPAPPPPVQQHPDRTPSPPVSARLAASSLFPDLPAPVPPAPQPTPAPSPGRPDDSPLPRSPMGPEASPPSSPPPPLRPAPAPDALQPVASPASAGSPTEEPSPPEEAPPSDVALGVDPAAPDALGFWGLDTEPEPPSADPQPPAQGPAPGAEVAAQTQAVAPPVKRGRGRPRGSGKKSAVAPGPAPTTASRELRARPSRTPVFPALLPLGSQQPPVAISAPEPTPTGPAPAETPPARDLRSSMEKCRLSEHFCTLGSPLADSLEASGLGVWEWDIVAGTIRMSPRFRKMLGLVDNAPGMSTARLGVLIDAALAEDRSRLDGAIRLVQQGLSTSVNIEFRICPSPVTPAIAAASAGSSPFAAAQASASATSAPNSPAARRSPPSTPTKAAPPVLMEPAATSAPRWVALRGSLPPQPAAAAQPQVTSPPARSLSSSKLPPVAPVAPISGMVQGVIEDVTGEREQDQQMVAAKDASEAASLSKSMFMLKMSQEIRTPLHGVMGLSALLLRTALSLNQRDYVEAIAHSGEELLTMVSDVLDMGQLETGKFGLEASPFSVTTLLTESLASIRSTACEKKRLDLRAEMYGPATHRMVAQPGGGAPVPAWAPGCATCSGQLFSDRTRVRQILNHLMTNAVKFTEQGEITVVVRVDDESDFCFWRSATSTDLKTGAVITTTTRCKQPHDEPPVVTTVTTSKNPNKSVPSPLPTSEHDRRRVVKAGTVTDMPEGFRPPSYAAAFSPRGRRSTGEDAAHVFFAPLASSSSAPASAPANASASFSALLAAQRKSRPALLSMAPGNLPTPQWSPLEEASQQFPGGEGVAQPAQAGPMHKLRFDIYDTGIGMAPEHLPVIFEPFCQVDTSFGGNGLGLLLCKKVLGMMGGAMGVESTLGKGSHFWFALEVPEYVPAQTPPHTPTPIPSPVQPSPFPLPAGNTAFPSAGAILPLDEAAAEARPAARAHRHHAATSSRRSAATEESPLEQPHALRILVAEDNPINLKVAMGMIRRMGHLGDGVSNGAEALKKLVESAQWVGIPGAASTAPWPTPTGAEDEIVTAAPRAAATRPRPPLSASSSEGGPAPSEGDQDPDQELIGRYFADIPIIALTAYVSEEDRQRCFEAGMTDYLGKPLNLTQLEACLRKWIPCLGGRGGAGADGDGRSELESGAEDSGVRPRRSAALEVVGSADEASALGAGDAASRRHHHRRHHHRSKDAAGEEPAAAGEDEEADDAGPAPMLGLGVGMQAVPQGMGITEEGPEGEDEQPVQVNDPAATALEGTAGVVHEGGEQPLEEHLDAIREGDEDEANGPAA